MNKERFLKLQKQVRGNDIATAMNILGDDFKEYMDMAINEERKKNGFEPIDNKISIIDVKKGEII